MYCQRFITWRYLISKYLRACINSSAKWKTLLFPGLKQVAQGLPEQ